MKKLAEMNIQERAEHLKYLSRRVSDLHVQYVAICRNPHATISPYSDHEQIGGPHQTTYQRPRVEITLANNIRLSDIAAESAMLMEDLHEFLNTVNNLNSETIHSVRQSFLDILQKDTPRG